MSLLPRLFLRGERMRPLGAPRRLVAESATTVTQSTHDWRCATAADGAPKLVRLQLTPEADSEAASFFSEYRDGNCSCHISPPCGSCTHPGNPLNQANDDTAWVWGHESIGSAA